VQRTCTEFASSREWLRTLSGLKWALVVALPVTALAGVWKQRSGRRNNVMLQNSTDSDDTKRVTKLYRSRETTDCNSTQAASHDGQRTRMKSIWVALQTDRAFRKCQMRLGRWENVVMNDWATHRHDASPASIRSLFVPIAQLLRIFLHVGAHMREAPWSLNQQPFSQLSMIPRDPHNNFQ